MLIPDTDPITSAPARVSVIAEDAALELPSMFATATNSAVELETPEARPVTSPRANASPAANTVPPFADIPVKAAPA